MFYNNSDCCWGAGVSESLCSFCILLRHSKVFWMPTRVNSVGIFPQYISICLYVVSIQYQWDTTAPSSWLLVAWKIGSLDLLRQFSLEAMLRCTFTSNGSAEALSLFTQVGFLGHLWGQRGLGNFLYCQNIHIYEVGKGFHNNTSTGRLSQGNLPVVPRSC